MWRLYGGQRNKDYPLGELYDEVIGFTALYVAVVSKLGPMTSKPGCVNNYET